MESLNRRVQNDLDAISRLKEIGYNVPSNFGTYNSRDRFVPGLAQPSQVYYPDRNRELVPVTYMLDGSQLGQNLIHQTVPSVHGGTMLETPIRSVRYSPVPIAST